LQRTTETDEKVARLSAKGQLTAQHLFLFADLKEKLIHRHYSKSFIKQSEETSWTNHIHQNKAFAAALWTMTSQQ